MRLVPGLAWTMGEPPRPVDARLVPLLQAIVARRSLASAVVEVGLSYRAAWGMLRSYEELLGVPLVDLARGRGATLAPAGERLVEAHRAALQKLSPLQRELTIELGARGNAQRKAATPLRLMIAASHDLALAALRDQLGALQGLDLELAFMGSMQALQAFHAGSVDVAGFHAPLRRGAAYARFAPLRQLLRSRRDRLVGFVEREQGLMLTRSQARNVRGLRDVAARQLTFVNRQRGSGTRMIVDALLEQERIPATAIRGYATEEFTHGAVAATIASGGAQAGFGLRAAAQEYDLAFVPLVRETYHLAVRVAALRQAPVERFLRCLRSPAFAGIVHALPGYRARNAGEILAVDILE